MLYLLGFFSVDGKSPVMEVSSWWINLIGLSINLQQGRGLIDARFFNNFEENLCMEVMWCGCHKS